jgi:hypothetical protein
MKLGALEADDELVNLAGKKCSNSVTWVEA